jgi:hypothetical protein
MYGAAAALAGLLFVAGGGLYWLAATVVISVLRSALDAWGLLMEAAGPPRAWHGRAAGYAPLARARAGRLRFEREEYGQ